MLYFANQKFKITRLPTFATFHKIVSFGSSEEALSVTVHAGASTKHKFRECGRSFIKKIFNYRALTRLVPMPHPLQKNESDLLGCSTL